MIILLLIIVFIYYLFFYKVKENYTGYLEPIITYKNNYIQLNKEKQKINDNNDYTSLGYYSTDKVININNNNIISLND